MKSMAESAGKIMAVLELVGLAPVTYRVLSHTWQGKMLGKAQVGKTKQYALAAAQGIWPDQDWKRTPRSTTACDGFVDAALIGEYGLRHIPGLAVGMGVRAPLVHMLSQNALAQPTAPVPAPAASEDADRGTSGEASGSTICPKCEGGNPPENKVSFSPLWICPCGNIWLPNEQRDMTAETEANANLIAAAPKLLERLNGLMMRLETIRETDKTGLHLHDDIESARLAIKRAIHGENVQAMASADNKTPIQDGTL